MLAEVTLGLKEWRVFEIKFGFLSTVEGSKQGEPQKPLKEDKERAIKESKEKNEIYRKILSELGCQRDVIEFGDLFDISDMTRSEAKYAVMNTSFPPIIAVLQLPPRVEGESDNRIATARFVVAFDGSLLLIGILDPVPEDYGRAFDARDRFIEILQKTAGFETIAPCLARSSLLLRVKGDDTISSADYVTSLVVTKNSDLKFAMKIAWLRLVELEFGFYGLCQISHREREIALVTIPSEENRLLENVKEFLSTRFFQIRKRRSISMKVRTQTTSILSLLSEHRLRTSLLSEEVAGFEERLPHNGLLKDLLMKNDWKDFVDPGVLDSESALAIVDHARSEMQAYGTISVTIWAAILGALLGSLVGFLLTLVIPRLV